MERNCSSFSTVLQRGRLIYVEARLQGGAPWGFTLKGGLEHGEALIISKVEEGGKADLLQHPLLVGDEVVNINEVELSGSRQEAISLVKGSYKTLRLTVCRRSEPTSRPHSWHSTKLGEAQQDCSMTQISQGTVGTPWHQTYHSSASTTDLSSYDPGYLRKSPDQYSSRGSMESLDHGHPAYSSCQQLSPSKSSGSIDHLHSKRDSAYSSFSTSSSVPEYPATAGLPIGKERCYSMESMLAPQPRGQEGPRQADIRYVRTVYDAQQGISEEHEVSPAGFLRGGDGRAHVEARGGGVHRGGSSSGSSSGSSGGGSGSASNRHSAGPAWGSARQHNSYESLKGAPPPPQRSDSYAAIRNHERPSSWSSLEQARSMRSLYKGSWHHSSGSVGGGKPSFATEGQQLHTLEEKSPESSPTTRPRQGLPQAPPTGRLMLPTGIYQVPPPEPHFAQAPASCPNSSSVYPALAKESRGVVPGDRGTGPGRGSPAVENGYQSSTSSTAGQPSCINQPKSPSQQAARKQEEPNYGPHFKPESHSGSQVQSEDYTFRRDPYTPVQQKGERQRHVQGPKNMERYRTRDEEAMVPAEQSDHLVAAPPQNSDALSEARPSLGGHRDGSVQNTRDNGGGPQAQRSEHGSRSALNHHGNLPAATQQDHPLTRLENALAEVQKAAGPERWAGQCASQGGLREEAPSGRVSVLEKVSRFEQQHRQGKVRSQSAGHVDCATPPSLASRAKSPKAPLHLRTQSYSAVPEDYGDPLYLPDLEPLHRRQSTEHYPPKSFWGKDMGLQRSKSTFQLGEENVQKEFPWREDLRDILGTIQDTSFNSAYRDSIKDAQSKVLRSTSFRRKDLSTDHHDAGKRLSLERKGPKTLPKPHTPKERHVVTPELAAAALPALPSVPPVGPPAVRIGSRKRLTLEQKKRCYSEPDKMNEVGVSEGGGCLSAYGKVPDQLHLHENSVADRRKLFELAAHRGTGPGPNPSPRLGLASSSSRSDLKQLQQDALAEYVERKTGRRMARCQRPQSAYLQPPSYSSDSQSLSSTSSLVSLQEPELLEASFSTSSHHRGGRVSSTLPPGLQGYFYPSGNRVQPPSSSESTSSTSSAHKPRGRHQRFFSLEQELDKAAPVPLTQPPQGLWLSQNCDTAFDRAAPARNSGKSASAEDLLDRSEAIVVPQHFRSRSSPSVERLNQDVTTGDYRVQTMFNKGSVPSIPTETRPVESAAPSLGAESYLSNLGPTQLKIKTPVSRREKQRHSERQRAQSMSGLAASVGLPCPFSSPGHPNPQASDLLCQASLEVLTQSLLPSPGPGVARKSSVDSSASEETLKDFPREEPEALRAATSLSSGEGQKSPPPLRQDPPLASSGSCSSPAESPGPSPAPPLPFLRISESSIHFTSSQPLLQDDDEVFFQEPAPPPPPPPPSPPPPLPPVWETDNAEDFPPPPPPPPLLPPITAEEQDHMETPQSPRQEHLQSTYGLDDSAANRGTTSPTRSRLPETCDLLLTAAVPGLDTEAQSPSPAGITGTEATLETLEARESLELEYPVLSRRERSVEELRVEALARELVSRDKSLTPILDTWATQKTMELMEEVFPALVLPRQRRGSSRLEDRGQDGVSVAEGTPVQREDGAQAGVETDLDEVEVDLSQKKVELAKALSQSVAVLRREREGLGEEQRRFSALSGHVEALAQELCKANEYDKYRMFVGDLEKIVNLLLSLCGQLARVENALAALEGEESEDSAEERETLQKKRRRLCGQHEDARELKENLDRRERLVLDILGGYLTASQLREYRLFVLVKPALLIRQRHLDELIRQGEEQLHRLGEDLQPESHAHFGSPAPCPSPPLPPAPPL
ncbi:hypothetical protein SKAU_G00357250 [Synaphobranchus kaupii]|uniref:Protein Shroom3 n=1 Tax=Synaphobranchus kaupii TaxID=118154 RepID=A0A9Q1IGQ9_SYNKA|nr:hypothetical protein SKAU_G00357250 [Synaphobranchus kaupii]